MERIGNIMSLANIKITRGGSGTRTFSHDLEPGLYQAQIVKVEEATKRKYKSEEEEPSVLFTLKLAHSVDGEDVYCRHNITPSLASKPKKSNLYKLIEALNPGAIAAGALSKDETAIPTIEGLKGRKCQIIVSRNVGRNGSSYTNLDNILGVAQQAETTTATKIDTEEVSFDLDDLPF